MDGKDREGARNHRASDGMCTLELEAWQVVGGSEDFPAHGSTCSLALQCVLAFCEIPKLLPSAVPLFLKIASK